LRAEFLSLINIHIQNDIIGDVESLINVLGSRDVALDGRHTPALYSRFLSSLLAKHRDHCQLNYPKPTFKSEFPPDVQLNCLNGSGEQFPGNTDEHVLPPVASSYTWPDRVPSNYYTGAENGSMVINEDLQAHAYAVQPSGMDMDLSLNHFVRTVAQGFSPWPTTSVDSTYWGNAQMY
jgi:transcriptional regulatory protein LEU3